MNRGSSWATYWAYRSPQRAWGEGRDLFMEWCPAKHIKTHLHSLSFSRITGKLIPRLGKGKFLWSGKLIGHTMRPRSSVVSRPELEPSKHVSDRVPLWPLGWRVCCWSSSVDGSPCPTWKLARENAIERRCPHSYAITIIDMIWTATYGFNLVLSLLTTPRPSESFSRMTKGHGFSSSEI